MEISRVYAGSLAGKEVVTIEGNVLGGLEDIVVEIETGELLDLVVKPDSGLPRQRYREDGKHVLIPFAAVCAIKDYVVVDESRAVKR